MPSRNGWRPSRRGSERRSDGDRLRDGRERVAVSSGVTLFPSDRRWGIAVPSMTGNAIRVEFATSSGGTDWAALHMRPDLTDVVVSSTVRPAFGWFYPVTCWALARLGANAPDVASFAFVPFTAR
jgi:hypothetical protein